MSASHVEATVSIIQTEDNHPDNHQQSLVIRSNPLGRKKRKKERGSTSSTPGEKKKHKGESVSEDSSSEQSEGSEEIFIKQIKVTGPSGTGRTHR